MMVDIARAYLLPILITHINIAALHTGIGSRVPNDLISVNWVLEKLMTIFYNHCTTAVLFFFRSLLIIMYTSKI